eukprot:5790389-Heterocapsa_arctica.AAC.1
MRWRGCFGGLFDAPPPDCARNTAMRHCLCHAMGKGMPWKGIWLACPGEADAGVRHETSLPNGRTCHL